MVWEHADKPVTPALDTGPDTFRIFEYSKGTVNLSAQFPFSGYHSVEIRDADNNGGFPELQGFFPRQEDFQSALLIRKRLVNDTLAPSCLPQHTVTV